MNKKNYEEPSVKKVEFDICDRIVVAGCGVSPNNLKIDFEQFES